MGLQRIFITSKTIHAVIIKEKDPYLWRGIRHSMSYWIVFHQRVGKSSPCELIRDRVLLIEVVIQSLQEKVVNTYMLVGDKVLMRLHLNHFLTQNIKKLSKGTQLTPTEKQGQRPKTWPIVNYCINVQKACKGQWKKKATKKEPQLLKSD